MEWFKHKTNSLDDPDFSAIIDEFGSDGYMMFFGLLEIYGREYSNTNSEQFLNIRLAFVARKLRKSSAKVRKFLNFCEKSISKARFVSVIDGAMLSYKAPEFIELSSNWTKRKKKQPTEAPTEAPTAIEVEEEEEVDKKKHKRKIPDVFPLTNKLKEYALEKGIFKAELDGIFEHFKNHHGAKGTLMLDWNLCWYNWVRNEIKFNPEKYTTPPEPEQETIEELCS